jgi:hypothetical protein
MIGSDHSTGTDCSHVGRRRLLDALLDGALAPAKARELEAVA